MNSNTAFYIWVAAMVSLIAALNYLHSIGVNI